MNTRVITYRCTHRIDAKIRHAMELTGMSYSEISSSAIYLYLRFIEERGEGLFTPYTRREIKCLPFKEYIGIIDARISMMYYYRPLFTFPPEDD